MPRKIYTRVSDHAIVPAETALNDFGGLRAGYTATSVLQDGERSSFSMAFMDSAASPARSHVLRDAVGAPVTLVDAASGSQMKLTPDHINAIETAASKAGLSVDAYVTDVLRYAPAN